MADRIEFELSDEMLSKQPSQEMTTLADDELLLVAGGYDFRDGHVCW